MKSGGGGGGGGFDMSKFLTLYNPSICIEVALLMSP